MRSTFGGLEISKRSLFAQQTALSTTGHNIANANTKGYTRQVVNLTASRPIEVPGLMRSNIPGQLGQGVEFDSINRIREGFLDNQFRNENKEYGSWTIRKDVLEKLEAITNEPSETGIRSVIEKFWSAWQDVSKEPENTTARAALKESTLAMTNSFNHVSQQLSDLNRDITENIGVKVREVNVILDQVARMNNEIFRVEGLGNDANDLRDQRDLMVDDLSKIVNITVDNTSGGYNIRMGNTELVNGINVITSFVDPNSNSDAAGITFESAFEEGSLTSGEVYGMIYARDNYLADYEGQLDAMIATLVEGDVEITLPAGTVLPPKVPKGTLLNGTEYTGTETLTDAQRVLTTDTVIKVKGLNAIHQLGYSLTTPVKSGIPFFTSKDESGKFTAASIQINPLIESDIGNLAASARVLTDSNNNIVTDSAGNEILVKGNNAIALAAASLRNKPFSFDPDETGATILRNGTFDEFYRAIVGQMGVQSQEASRQATNQQMLVEQVDARRQSVSGVSLDEEMANMIKYQHAYNAAARAMTTFDEMLDKIINSMGVVGR